MHRIAVTTGLAAILGMASRVAANAPNVTSIPYVSGDCSVYPGYDASTGVAGPWIIVADQTGNSSVDGHGATTSYERDYMPPAWGALTPLEDNTYAKVVLQCSGGVLQAYVNEYVSDCLPYCTKPLPDSPSDSQPPTWAPVQVSGWLGNSLVFQGEEALPAQLMVHEVNGQIQPGFFIGGETSASANSSTWGFTPTTNTRGQGVYALRLLGPTDALNAGEFSGFIKIDA